MTYWRQRKRSRSGIAVALVACTVLGVTGCARPSATVVAQSLVRQHREDEAARTLERRLESQPDDVDARKLLVRVHGILGDLASARADVAELAKRLPPGDPSPYIELGHAFELNHLYDEALASYDEAAQASPRSPDGPREGGTRAARWGELEEAAPRLEEALRRETRDADTWHTLGLVRLHLGDLDGAALAYRSGTVADPREPANWLGLATLGVLRGDARLALESYDHVLVRSPKFASAELGRAWALAALGRRDDALRALAHAEEMGAPPSNVARQRAALESSTTTASPTLAPIPER